MITDIEAEMRVLSSILHSETACIEAFSTIKTEDFTRPIHRDVYSLAQSLYTRGIIPTYVEVVKEGRTLDLIKDLHELNEIHYISQQYIDDENVRYWLGKVHDASKGRQFAQLLIRYQEEVKQKNLDIPTLIQKASSDFMSLALDSDIEKVETAEAIAELGERTVIENTDRWRELQENNKFINKIPLEGVPTGLSQLDHLTLGYKPGDLIILGAQTGHGKTAFALNSALAACVNGNYPILYVNTEMSRKQIAYRWGAILSQIPLQKIRTGDLTNTELYAVKAAYEKLSRSGLYTAHMPNLTPDKLDILARKTKLQHNIEMLILDYVGRMEKTDSKLQEWQVLEQIIKTQKILAQNLEIACMVLVQLNEDGSLQGAKRMKNECDLMLKLIPVNEDQANQIRLLHHKRYGSFNYRLYIDKSRDSTANIDIPINFIKEYQQIFQASEH